ncbi:MAG: FMN-binding protein [Aquiluna sp.]|nr:FMN-binding protein [Aquiluna sp.]MCF8545796.1 FMN-binding protein [Aquiluna sp.]
MRTSTFALTTLVAASSLTLAWSYGQQTSQSELLIPELITGNPNPTVTETSSAQPQEPGTSTSTQAPATPDPGATTQPTTAQPTQTQTATQAPAATQTATAAPAPVTKTVTSDPIDYKYGTVQISMTKTDGLITAINMVQGDATNGRAEAYVTLISATIQVQGTNYGNISGATFTTDAFKKAVDNVLKKF